MVFVVLFGFTVNLGFETLSVELSLCYVFAEIIACTWI